jgi:hypothetical protein
LTNERIKDKINVFIIVEWSGYARGISCKILSQGDACIGVFYDTGAGAWRK